jgi:hypothetical protein
MNKASFKDFLAAYPPDGDLIVATEEQISAYKNILPLELLHFWQEVGFGSFGNGFLHFFDPKIFQSSFDEWVLNPRGTCTPFARTSFGEFYYWRRLTDTEGDICILDVHTSYTDLVAYDFDYFIRADGYLLRPEFHHWLKLHGEVRERLSQPTETQMYYFVPALRLGGIEDAKHVSIGDAVVQMTILRGLI